MKPRNIINSVELQGEELKKINDNILRKYFSGKNEKMLEFRYNNNDLKFTYSVYADFFRTTFFKAVGRIYLCFPNGKDKLDIHEINSIDAVDYLLSSDTYDYETDIYIYTTNLEWCIRYIDEFLTDESRMTFLHINSKVDLDCEIIKITEK